MVWTMVQWDLTLCDKSSKEVRAFERLAKLLMGHTRGVAFNRRGCMLACIPFGGKHATRLKALLPTWGELRLVPVPDESWEAAEIIYLQPPSKGAPDLALGGIPKPEPAAWYLEDPAPSEKG
jgi:hypothetical protein